MGRQSPSQHAAILDSQEKTSALLVKKFWIPRFLRKTEETLDFKQWSKDDASADAVADTDSDGNP
jgi:hypothetical protein